MHTHLPIIFAAGDFSTEDKYSDKEKYPESSMTRLRTVMNYEIELYSQDGGISHLNGKSYPIKKGCLLISQPGDKRHSTLHFSALILHLETDDPAVMALVKSVGGFHTGVGFEKWSGEFKDICETALGFDPDSDIYASAKLLSFLCKLKKELFAASSESPGTSNYAFISNAIEYMQQAYMEPLTMDKIASHCGFSTSYLHKLFWDNVHMTPNNYLLNIRFTAAKNLLAATTLPIAEIAVKCGFNSQAYFSDSFKKKFSVSPREFRNSFMIGKS